MKLNTHDRTPRPKNSKLIKGLFLFCWLLIFSIFCLLSFACFYYAKSIVGGISVLLIPILMTAILLTHIKDMERAYVEIIDDEISVVDYYWGVKKEKHFALSTMLCIAIQNLSNDVNVVSEGSPSLMRRVLLISLGITILPRSSTRLTMPVAFIYILSSLIVELRC